MKKQQHRHCHITMTVIDQTTGEQRQLTEQEVASRLEKILAFSPAERIKMSLRRAGYTNEEKQP